MSQQYDPLNRTFAIFGGMETFSSRPRHVVYCVGGFAIISITSSFLLIDVTCQSQIHKILKHNFAFFSALGIEFSYFLSDLGWCACVVVDIHKLIKYPSP